MKILITGSAGFIGFHLTKYLLERGDEVVGVDNINNYYDPELKYARLSEAGINREAEKWHTMIQSSKYDRYRFMRVGLEESDQINNLFEKEGFDKVCNLAAQAGVRYSLENPQAYINSNIIGFLNILEACRHNRVNHLIYASSSSVYGNNSKMPLSTDDRVDNPISLYAATKKSNELMAHSYTHLFDLPTTGLRFFTVYGPWGRPDMALFLFTKAILNGEPVKIFNHGKMVRDFTYIDDIIEGVVRVIDRDTQSKDKKYRIYNIGNSNPVELKQFINTLEQELGMEAIKEYLPMQPGDVVRTEADVSRLIEDFNYKPSTPIEKGIKKFINWHQKYFT